MFPCSSQSKTSHKTLQIHRACRHSVMWLLGVLLACSTPSNRSDQRQRYKLYTQAVLHFFQITYLQNTLKEVSLAAREASPVGQDNERQLLPIKLLHGFSCLLSRVGEPHLPCLHSTACSLLQCSDLYAAELELQWERSITLSCPLT